MPSRIRESYDGRKVLYNYFWLYFSGPICSLPIFILICRSCMHAHHPDISSISYSTVYVYVCHYLFVACRPASSAYPVSPLSSRSRHSSAPCTPRIASSSPAALVPGRVLILASWPAHPRPNRLQTYLSPSCPTPHISPRASVFQHTLSYSPPHPTLSYHPSTPTSCLRLHTL